MVMVAQWDPTQQDTPPDTSHRQRWAAAVRQAAEGLSAPHLDRDRLTKAMDLVLAGKVTYTGHNAYTVQSGSHTYQLAPLCDCQDAQRRSKHCKHYLAVQLHQAAHAALYGAYRQRRTAALEAPSDPFDGLVDTPPAPTNGTVDPGGWSELEQAPITPATPPTDPPAEPAPVAQLPEAPASITLKWQDSGIDLLLTLRDASDEALFTRLKPILAKVKGTVARQHQADVQAANQGEIDAREWCAIHQCRMTPRKGGQWYSHQVAGKWCNGRQT